MDTTKAEHPLRESLRVYCRNYVSVAALFLLVAIVLMALIGPYLYSVDPFDLVWAPFTPPGEEGFVFGTDYLGRDLLAGILNGAQVTLTIGVTAAIMSVVIGVTIGALAGYYSGWIEDLFMKLTEFFQVLPTLLLSMVIVALFGASLEVITMAIGVVSWPAVARVTRSEFLRIRSLQYVTASRSCGSSNRKIIMRIILPNALPPIIVQATLMVGSAILFEAGLAFLGLTDPNVVSWGQIIGSNRTYVLESGYLVAIPGFAIFITVLSISLVGDGINEFSIQNSGRDERTSRRRKAFFRVIRIPLTLPTVHSMILAYGSLVVIR